MRGAWIEIARGRTAGSRGTVAPHAGGVDRNCYAGLWAFGRRVAPHAGGVDRNNKAVKQIAKDNVAPHAGGVDRNSHH